MQQNRGSAADQQDRDKGNWHFDGNKNKHGSEW